MSLPLEGIKVLDFTGVQAGPACTQLLAWYGADVLKIERPGVGDVTRRQLRDIPDADALYFTTLNSNKKSLELDTKTPEGKEILEKLIREADILVENFAPGALDRMGFSWERIQELNPRLIFGSVKGFGDNSRYADLKVYENVAQCAGGAASTTGFWDGPPTVSAGALGDSNSGMHLAIGLLTALIDREKTGRGQKVSVAMQDAVLNLCRVKLRDQQRLDRVGYLEEYPQYPNGTFGDAVPRGGNAGGGGQPGWVLKCKGWETDPNAYIYFTVQEQNWARTAEAIGHPEWANDPEYNTTRARQPHLFEIFEEIENWLADKTKHEAVDILRKYDIPCAPVFSMKELENDPDLRESGTIVEVEHKVRGKYLTVGSPIKFSGFKPEITGSPLLGEHTEEVLTSLGYTTEQIAALRSKKVI
ncbi:MAG: formyl-CoA transferase [Sulfobacillus benefaciens]|uniref:Formyl-CoA:oxalate CoA-transferase n=1 Tax=Sulfobacillus benefaciens TaxID=453960 RepID=A0A2T2XHK8_9FIRM|nr:MAG: formyl-CoA transferase [Sulfobacillus benefaciens]